MKIYLKLVLGSFYLTTEGADAIEVDVAEDTLKWWQAVIDEWDTAQSKFNHVQAHMRVVLQDYLRMRGQHRAGT